jgi:hypothetical protein
MLLRDAAQPRRTTRQLALVFGAFVVGFLLALCLTSMTAGNNSLYSQTSVAAQRPLPASHRLRAAEDSEPQAAPKKMPLGGLVDQAAATPAAPSAATKPKKVPLGGMMDQPMRKQVPTVGQYSKFKDVMPSDWAMSNPEPEEKDQRIIDLERGGDELDGVGFRLLSWLLLVGGATIQQWPLIFFVGIASFVIVYVLGDSFISY